tara:strand:+ start:1239 stop:1634 length:396 start_codon:yes stop_codon:yes gene_type:complete
MNSEKILNLIARIFISAIFIYAIPGKILNFQKTLEVITEKNIPYYLTPYLLICAILCLSLGSILFITGIQQKLGSILLLIFIIPTTIVFHFYPLQIKSILMNLGLIGGLLLGLNKSKDKSLKRNFYSQSRK